jgi:hypothetical protein
VRKDSQDGDRVAAERARCPASTSACEYEELFVGVATADPLRSLPS